MLPEDSLTTLDGIQPLIEDDLRNEDDLKNEDNLKNEDDLRNKDDLKYWPSPPNHFVPPPSP